MSQSVRGRYYPDPEINGEPSIPVKLKVQSHIVLFMSSFSFETKMTKFETLIILKTLRYHKTACHCDCGVTNRDGTGTGIKRKKSHLSSFVWQFSAEASLLRMSSSLPYGRFLPSDDVTTTKPYCAGFTHSKALLCKYKGTQ